MSIMRTLIWSEWRRQSKTVLFMLFTTMFLYSLISIFVQLKLFSSAISVVSGVLVIGLPALYAIALGDSFASEFINKSNSFLLGLPISRTKIYFSKYISSLSLFLAISTIGSLLMYTHNNFYKDASTKLFTAMILFLLSVWLLVHVAIFLCNLIIRNSNNGIIMLLILPVLLIILAPGIFVINMLFFTNDAYWFIASLFSTVLTLYAIILILGWYLWNMRISRDLKPWTPILKTLAVMYAASIMLYFCVDIYTKYQYESAEKIINPNRYYYSFRDAINSIDTLDAMCHIAQLQKYRKNHTSGKMHSYIYFAKRTHLDIWQALKNKQNDNTKFMLDDIAVQKMYLILEKVLDKHKTQHIKHFTNINYNTKIAIIFLVDLAYTQARAGKYVDFFKSLKVAAIYCVFLKRRESRYDRSNASSLLRLVYLTMIKLGPEGVDYTKNYQEALKFIQNNKIYCPPYFFIDGFYNATALANPRSTPNVFNKIYYRLRARQGLISWMKYIIKCKKLYQEAEKSCDLKDIIKKNKLLIQDSKKIVGYCKIFANKEGKGLNKYFIARSRMTGDKICLALKIFRCRYGKYPDKLQELCPEIFKKLPLVPMNQKAYKYKKDKDGFILSGGRISRRQRAYNFYKMKYQPLKEKK